MSVASAKNWDKNVFEIIIVGNMNQINLFISKQIKIILKLLLTVNVVPFLRKCLQTSFSLRFICLQ